VNSVRDIAALTTNAARERRVVSIEVRTTDSLAEGQCQSVLSNALCSRDEIRVGQIART
jgi:hypothetical protein